MPGSDLACIFAIVAKVLVLEHPVFIAQQSIGLDVLRIKVQLNLDVFGDRH